MSNRGKYGRANIHYVTEWQHGNTAALIVHRIDASNRPAADSPAAEWLASLTERPSIRCYFAHCALPKQAARGLARLLAARLRAAGVEVLDCRPRRPRKPGSGGRWRERARDRLGRFCGF